MATTLQQLARPVSRIIRSNVRTYSHSSLKGSARNVRPVIFYATGATVGAYLFVKYREKISNWGRLYAKESMDDERVSSGQIIRSQRELRFLSFASLEYDGSVYMTPQDFLESITEEFPRPRTGRTRLRDAEVSRFINNTPNKKKGGTHLFRQLHNQGLISYTEYLFLLCVLTKPRSGFRIAFNMFDTDGNQRVDKKEFLVLLDVFRRKFVPKNVQSTEIQPNMSQNIWSILNTGLRDEKRDIEVQNTTLLVHYFGQKGNDVLTFEDFKAFMENLQTEVLELEFNEFARGMKTITEEEFAKILLRYTILSADDQEDYVTRLKQKIPQSKGITFKAFKDFGQFLNNLDNFAIALRLYTYSDHAVTEAEFKRAVKVCTGFSLDDHLVHTVFQLFDLDGDNHLSSKEFISVMSDRLHRGFKTHTMYQSKWDSFKVCIRNEMRAS